jgi:alpha-glucoside transport system substrate-binding protein
MRYGKRLAAVTLATALVAVACGSDDDESSSASTDGGSSSSAESLLDGAIKCENQYEGKEVRIFSPVRDSETDKAATRLRDAYAPLEACTGLTVAFDGTDQFETEIKVRMDGGNPPDLIDFPQPGGFLDLIAKGQLKPFPDALATMVTEDNVSGWPELATVDGKVYGVPARANVKSMVWYSPAMFTDGGYEIPQTLDELIALSDKIAADGGAPWCAGIESGVATGWPITDWFEDTMLRLNGEEVYDQWVRHEIPFNDPKVLAVADFVGSILKNPDYIAGGEDGVKSIATTKFQDGGFPILEGECYMHKQASFYSTIWPAGTAIGEDGAVNYFYFPTAKAGDPKYMLGGGDLIGAGTDKPETFDTLMYTGSLDYSNALVAAGDKSLPPLKAFDTSAFSDPVTRGFAELLKNSEIFRFDGADMMPAAVGSGTFWQEATKWITGETDNQEFVDNVEESWASLG